MSVMKDINSLQHIAPFLTYRWEAEKFPDVGGASGEGLEDLVQSVDLPFPRFNVENVFGAGTYMYYTGIRDVDSLNVTFLLDTDLKPLKYLLEWNKFIRDPETGFFELPSKYKKKIEFNLYNYAKEQRVGKASCINCWPTTVGNIQLSHEDTPLTVSVTFSVDEYTAYIYT